MSTEEGIVVTPETFKRLSDELEELKTNGRDEISVRLRKARELGDIRENAEFAAAQEAQGLMEARIRNLQHTVNNATVRKSSVKTDEAGPGVVIEVREVASGDEDTYLLAASAEERAPGIRTVTTSSPLGKALVGKKAGDVAKVDAPGGTFEVELIKVKAAG